MKEISPFIISLTDIVFTDDFLASDFVYKHAYVRVHTHTRYIFSFSCFVVFIYLSFSQVEFVLV